MDRLLDWGVDIILWCQQFSPALDQLFIFFTLLGGEDFFMLLLPLVYWCMDRGTGARLTLLFLVSVYVNAVLKVWCGQPRPFQYDESVQKLFDAGGEGFPSGHTQGAVVLWGYLAARFKRKWLFVLAGILIVMIPLSRVYLGVHFPTDLIGGYAIGVVLLLLFIKLVPGVEQWLGSRRLIYPLSGAIALPILLVLIFPTGEEYGITAAASLLGMGVGFALEGELVGFDPAGPWWKKVLRYILGIIIVLILRFGLSGLFSGLEPALLFRFIRYTVMGAAGALGIPWIFVRFNLAGLRSSGT